MIRVKRRTPRGHLAKGSNRTVVAPVPARFSRRPVEESHMLVGDIDIHPVSDGTFRASPAYFGDHARPDGHEDLFTRDGMAWLPIGCFIVRTGVRTILVDAGMGPAMRDDGPRRLLIGGQLLLALRAVGITAADVTDV